ncbi:YpjP family protein [Bacillus tuaregi]|uniref:YpjP family protein n=1 Tax=Bacillus tuaregi TaxID=1816695 RepID=UPI0008F93B21|nr:YpjP family protein [Bacillus tuaregi]
MPKWLRKSLLVLVTIATFGLVTPQALMNESPNEDKQAKRDTYETNPSITEDYFETEISERDQFINEMVKVAEEQSYVKFGMRIKPVIQDEFKEVILPNMEKAIAEVAAQYPDEDLSQLMVSEVPSGGVSERIFHIMDNQTKMDIIRFHVRRDHPPQEEYMFNFHYHTSHDQFQAHHDLGIINWNKNTPPKWMT